MVVLIASGWGGVGKGMDLTIQKQRTSVETKGMALIWVMTVELLQ